MDSFLVERDNIDKNSRQNMTKEPFLIPTLKDKQPAAVEGSLFPAGWTHLFYPAEENWFWVHVARQFGFLASFMVQYLLFKVTT